MTTKTRYFVIASLLLLGVGIGSGLVAYYSGHPLSAFMRRGGPDELKYVPQDATVLAYADVQDVMHSQLRQKMHDAVPMSENGQREFQDQTGINIETDIEHVVAFAGPGVGADGPHGGMVLARGHFDALKIETLMRDRGAHVEDYKGAHLIIADMPHATASAGTRPDMSGLPGATGANDSFAVSFIEPRLVAVGNARLVRAAIDQKDGPNVTNNEEMMKLVRSLEGGNAWAVGRFDAIQKQAHLPANMASQIPPITWFSISSHVNGGISGAIRAETRDDESANNLRDVVGGFLALVKLQAGSKPEFQALIHSLDVRVTGKTVELTFAIPAEAFDAIGALARPGHKPDGR